MLNTLQTQAFGYHKATEREFSLLNEFDNRMRTGYWPESPPLKLEQPIKAWRFIPPYRDVKMR